MTPTTPAVEEVIDFATWRQKRRKQGNAPIKIILLLLGIAGGVVLSSMGSKNSAGKQFLNLDGQRPPGFTHVVSSPPGRTIYVSGLGGRAADGALPQDFHSQADNTFKNIGRALKLAGADFKDVVKINYFVTDLKNLQELRDVRSKYLDMDAPPAATLVQAGLAGDLQLEVECVAIVPGQP